MSAELSRLVAESGQCGIAVEKALSPGEGMTDWSGTLRICPNCGFENIDQTFYCSRCAAQIREFPKESPFTESNRNSSINKINSRLGRRRRNKNSSDSSQKGLHFLISDAIGMFIGFSFWSFFLSFLIIVTITAADSLAQFLGVWLVVSLFTTSVYYVTNYLEDREVRLEMEKERNKEVADQKKP